MTAASSGGTNVVSLEISAITASGTTPGDAFATSGGSTAASSSPDVIWTSRNH
jgi:hypothetical protein